MDESFYLKKCLLLLEEKLNWGDSQYWTQDNFKELSEYIYQSSRVSISTHTLRRIFDRLPTPAHYKPQSETRNALAIALGFRDWEDFKLSQTQTITVNPVATEPIAAASKTGVHTRLPKRKRWLMLAVPVCLLGLLLLLAVPA